MPRDMSKSCEFPSLDSCQKGFLWAYKKVSLALYPVIWGGGGGDSNGNECQGRVTARIG